MDSRGFQARTDAPRARTGMGGRSEGCEVAEKRPEERSTWMCSFVSDGFQGSGRRFGLKINYPIAKRQRQGNTPRMEPASATAIMKGNNAATEALGERKSEDGLWRGEGPRWKQQESVDGRPQAGCARGKCLRCLCGRPGVSPKQRKLGRDLACVSSVLLGDPT